MNFDLTSNERTQLWGTVVAAIESYYENTEKYPVAPNLSVNTIKEFISDYAGSNPDNLPEIMAHVITGLTKYAVHTPHPAYFGLFNPRSNFPGILADALTAAFNPQLAAWSHAPFAVEVENYLVKLFSRKFGFNENDADGVFTTGGAEANLTAMLCALNEFFPAYAESGLQGLPQKPVIYCSTESHHSVMKSARITGLGSHAVRIVPVNEGLKLDVSALETQINQDKQSGLFPMMIIATAGTTGAGVIDPLIEIAALAAQNQIWLHVDAAYGGGLVLSSKTGLLKGIDKADSITFDAHKWLSVPMGTSIFLTRKPGLLDQTFRITAEYMPKEAQGLEVTDPFVHSIQWSRRFNGLKLYLALLMLGETGYRETIDSQIATGNLLRRQLTDNGWQIYNETELPVICFSHPLFEDDISAAGRISQHIISKGKAWLSVYPIGGKNMLRACITNYNTGSREVSLLINELNTALNLLQNKKD